MFAQIDIVVRDLGIPLPKTGSTARIVVKVTRNLYSPNFLGEPYAKNITETVDVGSSIFQVIAEDKDSRVCIAFFYISFWWLVS